MNPPPRLPLWLWPNLLSLDAPLVALVWQDFLARCFPSTLLPAGRWTLGLSVWAIYLADRMIDVRHARHVPDTAPCYNFYRRHFRAGLALLAAVIAADLGAATRWLRPVVLSNGLWVSGAVISYLFVFALLRATAGPRKRFSAALLFTAGVFLVAWASIPQAASVLLAPALAFFVLVLENLILIQRWQTGQPPQRISLWLLPLALMAAWWGQSRWYAGIAFSMAALAVLDHARPRLPRDARRVLADVVLLTPLFL